MTARGPVPSSVARALLGIVLATMAVRQFQAKVGGDPGELVYGLDELAQSLRTVLTTPEGSVPGRPAFGSRLHLFVDQPVTLARPGVLREVARAAGLHEPRIVVQESAVVATGEGRLELDVTWVPSRKQGVADTTAPQITRIAVEG